jgi:hypothetical protein
MDLSVKDYGRAPRHVEAESGNPTSIKMLLETDVDIDAVDVHRRTALHEAVVITRWKRSQYPRSKFWGKSPLKDAVYFGRLHLLRQPAEWPD